LFGECLRLWRNTQPRFAGRKKMDRFWDFLAGLLGPMGGEPKPIVNVVRLSGIIGGMGGLRRGLTLEAVEAVLEHAFKGRRAAAVALVVNSPGGSPVQSGLIAGRIRALAEKHEKPVHAFIEDVGASGGYWLACAGDDIHAGASSVVGSIGVVSGGFGFTELMKRVGVERRLHTAGDKKAMLDPFSAQKTADVKHLKSLQKDVHDEFIEAVKERRQGRLIGEEGELFSGAFWSGTQALRLGLIDGIGDLRQTMIDRYGEEVRFHTIAARKSFWRRRLRMQGPDVDPGTDFFDGLGRGLLNAIEEKLTWNRFGL